MLGFTIDSITLFLDREDLTSFDFKKLKKLIRGKDDYYERETWIKGFYKKMKVSYHENHGIYISGSISNYYKGHSSIMQYKDLESAIEKLGDELNLYLHSSRLYRIDLALNLITDNPIEQYSHHLFTDLTRFDRLEQVDGVRFETNNKVIAIYNKSKEIFEKRGIVVSNNVLRIELRLLEEVSSTLGIDKCEIQNLYSLANYKKLVSLFLEKYNEIWKQTVPKELEELDVMNQRVFKDYLMRVAIETVFGSEKDAYRYIEQLDNKGSFKDANTKSRTKAVITNLAKNKFVSILHPLAEEINKKVEDACNEVLDIIEYDF